MRNRALFTLLTVILPLAAQVKEYKPAFFNLFSVQQDIQLGKDAASQVEKTQPVVRDEELTGYVSRVGARLAKSKRAGAFPFRFQVINDKSINAFALPGGPIFVHTGLISVLDNESQLAGVLAHEMSHVTLRHGTNQASKANLLQLPAMLASSAVGNDSMLNSLAQVGIGLTFQSALLKYSRDAERDADLNGAQIMNDAGYDPVQMAVFFQKLETQVQKDNGLLANWLSDHPPPGNRVKNVQDQNKYLPKVKYSDSEAAALPRVKTLVAALPPPPPPKPTAAATASAHPPEIRPSKTYKQYQGRAFTISYPDNWQTFGEQDSASVTVAPKEALIADGRGQTQIGYGFLVSYFPIANGKVSLSRDTDALIKQLQQGTSGLKRTSASQRNIQVAGQAGLVTPLESPSPYQGEREVDMLLTVAHPEGLFYVVFIAPGSEWSSVQGVFDDVIRSIRF